MRAPDSQKYQSRKKRSKPAFSGAATRLDHFSELSRRDTFRTPQQKLSLLIMYPADPLRRRRNDPPASGGVVWRIGYR